MEQISVQELKRRMDAGEKLNIIDVREPHEYAEFNLGGILVPMNKIQSMQIDEIEGLQNEEVIIHCRSGHRSTMACMFLETQGFTNTKNLAGGVIAWAEMVAMGKGQ